VLLTKVVDRSLPFQRTTELETNPLPLTVSVKVAPPAMAVDGDKEVRVGTGLLMANVTALDSPPAGVGLETVTSAVPAAVTSLAGIAACNWVPLRKVVGRSVLFQRTTEEETKPLPVTVKVNPAEPAVMLEGDKDVSAGFGFPTVKVAFAVPPPGGG
jgi:hypothetical protein